MTTMIPGTNRHVCQESLGVPGATLQTALASEDKKELGAAVGSVVNHVLANPKQLEQYRGGEQKVSNFFIGQVMKRTRGKADPGVVQDHPANTAMGRLVAGIGAAMGGGDDHLAGRFGAELGDGVDNQNVIRDHVVG